MPIEDDFDLPERSMRFNKWLCVKFRQVFIPALEEWENENLYNGKLGILTDIARIDLVRREKECDGAQL